MTTPMTTSSVLAPSLELNGALPRSRYLCFGPFQIDLQREELYKEGERVRIPSKVYQVLLTLIERPGEVATREDLRARLWPAGTFVNYDANVNTTVNKLRLALGDSPDHPSYIETIPRHGYCFVAPVERKNELAKAALASPVPQPPAEKRTAQFPAEPEGLSGRLPKFLVSGWAAAVLLGGVLIGMGIVLIAHRPF